MEHRSRRAFAAIGELVATEWTATQVRGHADLVGHAEDLAAREPARVSGGVGRRSVCTADAVQTAGTV
jgi:hypothetical protein